MTFPRKSRDWVRRNIVDDEPFDGVWDVSNDSDGRHSALALLTSLLVSLAFWGLLVWLLFG